MTDVDGDDAAGDANVGGTRVGAGAGEAAMVAGVDDTGGVGSRIGVDGTTVIGVAVGAGAGVDSADADGAVSVSESAAVVVVVVSAVGVTATGSTFSTTCFFSFSSLSSSFLRFPP